MTKEFIIKTLGLNSYQAKALDLDNGAILAGAGAGKTQTLAAIVCKDILVEGISPSDVAVVTFTKAASANLVRRIQTQMKLLGSTQNIDDLYVSTIDALWARLLRENVLETSLVPGFRVIEPRSLFSIRYQAWMRTIDASGLDLEELYDADFYSLMMRNYEALGNLGLRPKHMPVPVSEEPSKLLAAKIKQLISDLLPVVTPAVEAKLAQDLEAFSDNNWTNQKYGNAKADIKLKLQEIGDLITSYRGQLDSVEQLAKRKAFRDLLIDFDTRFAASKIQENVVDFGDLSFSIQSWLLKTSRKFTRLYIDEAQDTNPFQLSLLSALCKDSVVIGDALQSIYAFRGADVEGFKSFTKAKPKVELLTNYRSGPELMNNINFVCSKIPFLQEDLIQMEPHSTESRPNSFEVLRIEHSEKMTISKEAEVAVARALEVQKELGLANKDIAVLCADNRSAETYAKAFRSQAVPVVLFQNKGLFATEESKDILAYLRFLCDPTPEDLVRVLSSPLVGVLDQALYDHKGFGLEDFPELEAKVAQHRLLLETHSSEQIAKIVLEDFDFLAVLDNYDPTSSKRRNVEKIVRMLASEAPKTLAETMILWKLQIEAGLDEGQDADTTADAVKVMTIHNSKGDEFALTLVGALSKRAPNLDSVLLDQKGNIWISSLDPGFLAAKEHHKKAKESEDRRMFYVAITRAEKHLMVVASKQDKKKWEGKAKWLFEAVPELLTDCKIASHLLEYQPSMKRTLDPPVDSKEIVPDFAVPVALPVLGKSISYTSLAKGNVCSLRFQLENHEFEPGPDLAQLELPSLIQGTGYGAEFGTRVHKALESVDWKQPLLQGFDDNSSAMFDWLITTDLPSRLKELKLESEKSFGFALEKPITGIIDVYAKGERALIIDWKTGSPDQQYQLQSKIYALAALFDGALEVEVLFVYLGKQIVSKVYSKNQEQELSMEISAMIQKLDEAKPLEHLDAFCSLCPGLVAPSLCARASDAVVAFGKV